MPKVLPSVGRMALLLIEFQNFEAGKKLAFEKQPFSQGLMVLNKKEVDGWSTFEGRLTLIMCNWQVMLMNQAERP